MQLQKIENEYKELSLIVEGVLTSGVQTIENSLKIASALSLMREKLTPELMKPIMDLQGSRLGFKTDLDFVKRQINGKWERVKGDGYPMETVRECFLEMALIGLLPMDNQWNIIGGNAYPAQNGAIYLLKTRCPEMKEYNVSFPEVNQSDNKTTANVVAKIEWTLINGQNKKEVVNFPVKSDAYTTFDALIGKAQRKAYMWLYNKIKGTNISDGDVVDVPHQEVKTTVAEANEEKRVLRIKNHIEKSKSVEELQKCFNAITETDVDLKELYNQKSSLLNEK
jgi:hypothetical protein